MTRPFAFTASQRSGGSGSVTPTPTPTPTPSITTIVHDADSISNSNPGVVDNSYFPTLYGTNNPTLTLYNRAQPSRTVGGAAYAAEGADTGVPTGNTLLDHRAEDIAYAPQLYTTMIGANDLGAFAAQGYFNRLVTLTAPIRAAGIKVAYSPPTPYRQSSPQPNYTQFTTNRTALFNTIGIRDPAVWSQFADYYYPMGEHPDFLDTANDAALYGDGIHPTGPASTSTTGQARLYAGYAAFMDSVRDATRVNATQMYSASWPVSQTGLAASTVTIVRLTVKGIAHTGLALGAGVSGGGAQLSLNGGAYATSVGTGSGNGYRIYNGDVIDLKITTSASSSTAVSTDLTIGSETRTLSFTTVAAVTPAAYVHGDVEYFQPGSTGLAITRTFPATGVAVIAFNGQNGTSSVKVGGVEATPRILQVASGILVAYTVPVTAGSRAIELTFTGFTNSVALSWGVVSNADATPVQIDQSAPSGESNPHNTGTLTVPASGIAVGLYSEYAGGTSTTPATVVSGSTLIDEGQGAYQGEVVGVAVATRMTSGTIGFNSTFGGYCRGALVFKAAGT